MNNVKIVVASLASHFVQVKACFGETIEQTHLFLFSILVQNRTNTEYQLRIIFMFQQLSV